MPVGAIGPPAVDEDFSEDEPDEIDTAMFYVRCSTLKATEKRIQHQRIHVTAQGNSAALACGRMDIKLCEALGSVLPDIELLCKFCKNARPDLKF